mgnify:CR=1 FL=1
MQRLLTAGARAQAEGIFRGITVPALTVAAGHGPLDAAPALGRPRPTARAPGAPASASSGRRFT